MLAAEFVNAGKVQQVLWYTDGSGKGGYYGFDGQSRRRAFLASPMAFSRVTSGFSMRMPTWPNDSASFTKSGSASMYDSA